jgi:mono/diheme cytochrome c family protein
MNSPLEKRMAFATCFNHNPHRFLQMLRLLSVLMVTWSAAHLVPAFAAPQQEIDPEEPLPGLRLVLATDSQRLQLVQPRPVLATASGRLDARLPVGGAAEFSGLLLVRSGGPHRFHVQLSGNVEIFVDDRSVLKAVGEQSYFSGEPVELAGGEHAIRIVWLAPADASVAGLLQVFWSSPDFTLEPLPADVLSRLPDAAEEAAAVHAASGRFLTDSLRCGACHQGWSEGMLPPAPNLTDSIRWLSDAQIAARLTAGDTNQAMPHFDFDAAEAADVTAFLRAAVADAGERVSKPVELPAAPKFKDGDAAAGEKLLLTLGCIACHEVDSEIASVGGPFGGPDLRLGGEPREAGWLMQWLKDPQSLNRDHRMPVFALSDDERQQLTAALIERRRANRSTNTNADNNTKADPSAAGNAAVSAARGRMLVQSAGCAACHQIQGVTAAQPKAFAAWSAADAANSCVQRKPLNIANVPAAGKSSRPPRYNLKDEDTAKVRAWLSTVTRPLSEPTGRLAGQLQLERKSCLACHDRDGAAGLSEIAGRIEGRLKDLRGQAQALIPPALTAVGDRLRDEVLSDAVGGGQERRLPWLLVRMPKFVHSEAERQSLVQLLITEDRIPDAADGTRSELFEHYNPQHPALATPAELYSGNQLAGAGGFQCTACHKAGAWEPRNVAMGTRGSDLMLMGRRLRSRYFLRWMANPIRVVPGIEMPQLRKPVDRGLNESLGQQIAELWKALADPRFVPPTVVSRYEQVAALLPGDRPRVIRDVFLAEGSPVGAGTARAIAVGFGNGHSLLLDLDSGRLVNWTAGEFARQRTEGKSWFWDLAGVPLAKFGRALAEGEFLLRLKAGDKLLPPVRDESRTVELLSVEETGNDVIVRLRLHFLGSGAAGDGAAAGTDFVPQSPHSPVTAWSPRRGLEPVVLRISLTAISGSSMEAGVAMKYELESAPAGSVIECQGWELPRGSDGQELLQEVLVADESGAALPVAPADGPLQLAAGKTLWRRLTAKLPAVGFSPPPVPPLKAQAESIDCVPGFQGERLPLPTALMPTGLAWFADGRLAISSLRGEVRILRDSDADGRYDAADVFAAGLAAPYGILVDGSDVLVSHKPEVLRLRDRDGDGRADFSEVLASGWGFSDDYHDWTSGLTRDADGNLYVGLGSDYSQNKRAADNDRWRGTILKISRSGGIEPIAYSMRFPMGLTFDSRGRLFATDNQGVQNTFNEINHIQTGKRYGVPSRYDQPDAEPESPALQVPHPWTRSVNSLAFFPPDYPVAEFRGHAVGCEYDTQCLIRMSFQDVGGVVQGACYRFSRPPIEGGSGGLQGPISCGFGPDHALYIGSLRDSGWQGAGNTGGLEKLVPTGRMPNGIREIRAVQDGFEVDFFDALSTGIADTPAAWDLQSLTRVWKGSYATPDSERRTELITEVRVSDDRRTVRLVSGPHRAGFLYELRMQASDSGLAEFWPTEGFYWMKRTPENP